MKKYLIICATLLMAACSREGIIITKEVADEVVVEEPQPAEDPAEKVTYIEAKSEKTKASIDDATAAFTWNTGDKVAVYAGGYKISDDLSSTYDGQGSATFAFSGSEAFDDADRANFAVFPASLAYDGNGNLYASDVTASSLKVNLPASYTLAQVQGEVSPVPMIATNAPNGGLTFKNICALVRLTVNNISKDANTLKITFPGKKVQGEFTLTGVTAGTTATVTANTSGADDTITITDLGISAFTSGLVISVPVPTGVASSLEYGDVVVGAYDANNHKIHSIATPIKDTPWVPTRLSAKKVTANLPVFTVANDKKVVFAPGNLKAVLAATFATDKPSYASSWSFAAHQYDAIGDYTPANKTYSDNSFRSPYVGVVFDLFAWFGQSATGFVDDYADDKYKYGIIRPSSNIRSFTGETKNEDILLDWGHNTISDSIGEYPVDTWRTPSPEDWDMAILTRNNHVFLRATITDASPVAHGLIITPDQYSHPAGVAAFSNTNVSDGACSDNEYTINDWEKLEAAGCVFFPMTNHREKSSGALATAWPGDGCYWTNKAASGSTPKSKAFLFTDTSLGTVTSIKVNGVDTQMTFVDCNFTTLYRYIGYAVRLVRDVN